MFGLYIKEKSIGYFRQLKQFDSMDEVFESTVIEDTPFKEAIMADETLLTEQD